MSKKPAFHDRSPLHRPRPQNLFPSPPYWCSKGLHGSADFQPLYSRFTAQRLRKCILKMDRRSLCSNITSNGTSDLWSAYYEQCYCESQSFSIYPDVCDLVCDKNGTSITNCRCWSGTCVQSPCVDKAGRMHCGLSAPFVCIAHLFSQRPYPRCPCKNGGTMTDSGECLCPLGYSGAICDDVPIPTSFIDTFLWRPTPLIFPTPPIVTTESPRPVSDGYMDQKQVFPSATSTLYFFRTAAAIAVPLSVAFMLICWLICRRIQKPGERSSIAIQVSLYLTCKRLSRTS